MDKRKEILMSNLAEQAKPTCEISDVRSANHWERITYKTTVCSGTGLSAMQDAHPQPITLSPKLSGWYKIFVCIINAGDAALLLKLSDDGANTIIDRNSPSNIVFDECYWKSADLSKQDIEISKPPRGIPFAAAVAWFRFVPMSKQEVSVFQSEQIERKNKRLYATNDMHNMSYFFESETTNEWKSVIQQYEDSDVGVISLENLMVSEGKVSDGNIDDYSFCRPGDKCVQHSFNDVMSFELLSKLVDYGHSLGFEMNISRRMGYWDNQFPFDKSYFSASFAAYHKELACIDRDGEKTEFLSYAFPEVREYVISEFEKMALTGCEGVEMILTRCAPYVLFEEPAAELFSKRFGSDIRTIPFGDSRLSDIRCEIMTSFVNELKVRLAACRKKAGMPPVKIIARTGATISCWRKWGVDVYQLAKLGLIDGVISYPMLIIEPMRPEFCENGLVSPEKYREYYESSDEFSVIRYYDCDYKDVSEYYSDGDPSDEAVRISEFTELTQKFGTKVWFEIMPRLLPPKESQRKALEIYANGGENISLWDSYTRAKKLEDWSMFRRLGHKEELHSFVSSGYFRHVKIISINGKNIHPFEPMWGS